MGDEPTTVASPPFVSIVIPAFNSAAFIAAAVDSLLAQNVGDWEAVIVDDGSTDDTALVAQRAAGTDRRIRFVSQPNSGTAEARNTGAALAQAEWLLFLDADDELLPDYIECQMAFAESHRGFDIYSCNAMLERPDGTRRKFWSDARSRREHSLKAEDQIRESSILIMSLVSRSAFDRLGGFRSLHSEDYDFWLRALLDGARHIYNPAALAVYRRHEGQRTRSLVKEAESFLWILEDNAQRTDLWAPSKMRLRGRSLWRVPVWDDANSKRTSLAGGTPALEACIGATALHFRTRQSTGRASP